MFIVPNREIVHHRMYVRKFCAKIVFRQVLLSQAAVDLVFVLTPYPAVKSRRKTWWTAVNLAFVLTPYSAVKSRRKTWWTFPRLQTLWFQSPFSNRKQYQTRVSTSMRNFGNFLVKDLWTPPLPPRKCQKFENSGNLKN